MKKRFFLAGVVALGMLTGCNNEYDGQDIAGSKLIVTASIDQVKTRVSDTEWTVGDAIGVSDNLSQNPNLNIKYVAGSTTGDFTSTTGIYILGSDPVTYTAYYPYTGAEGTATGDIEFSILNSEGQYAGDSNVDYLFATATVSRENPTVGFQFKHVMSRLKLTINDSKGEVAEGTDLSYTLSGVTTNGTFHTADGTVTAGTNTGNIVVKTTMGSASSVILPPTSATGTPSTIQLVIEINDKVYTGSFTPALVASQEYQYSIDLSNTGSGSKLQIDSPTIEGFTPNDEGDIHMNVTANYNPTLEVGDFICTDGTQIDKDYDLASLDAEVKESIVGVVYYVGNPGEDARYAQGLVIALNRVTMDAANESDSYAAAWASEQPTSEVDGWEATAGLARDVTVIRGYKDTQAWQTVTAAWWDGMSSALENYTVAAPAEASGWYVPSQKELYLLQENTIAVNTSLNLLTGAEELWKETTFVTGASNSRGSIGYWSSTYRARNAVLQYAGTMTDGKADDITGYTNRNGYFRLVFAF